MPKQRKQEVASLRRIRRLFLLPLGSVGDKSIEAEAPGKAEAREREKEKKRSPTNKITEAAIKGKTEKKNCK